MLNILSTSQIQSFIQNGFVCIDNAFSDELAAQARDILWKDIPFRQDDPTTWNQPVVRLGMYNQPPYIEAANTPLLHAAFDQLAGKGKWVPCGSMGSFPVRFPCDEDTGDTGWHVDAGFPGDDPADYFSWRINIKSKGRGLLMLFLFSDTGVLDAPTRLLKGSHLQVAQMLQPEGERGLSFMELATRVAGLPEQPIASATGKAGTVYLCHPFLVHAAQANHGRQPKFMAQPPLLLKQEFGFIAGHLSPVEEAIKMAVDKL